MLQPATYPVHADQIKLIHASFYKVNNTYSIRQICKGDGYLVITFLLVFLFLQNSQILESSNFFKFLIRTTQMVVKPLPIPPILFIVAISILLRP